MDTGSCSYHGAGIQNRVIDTSFPYWSSLRSGLFIPVVLRFDPSKDQSSFGLAVLLNRSDDQEGRRHLSGVSIRPAALSEWCSE